MPVKQVAGIAFEEAGRGGVPLLCLHGIGGDARSFAPQLAGLSDTCRVIAWTMPGYGRSAPMAAPTFPKLADKLAEFLDALGLARAHLCGHSIGGMVALEAACRFPHRVASLSLIATTAAFGGRDDSFKRDFIAARLGPLDEGRTLAELARTFVPEITGPIATADVREAAIAAMAAVPPETYRAIIRCLVTFDRRADIAALSHPACLIAGQHDRNAPPGTMARMAARMPNAEVHLIPGAGHLVNLEAGAQTNGILRSFLGRH